MDSLLSDVFQYAAEIFLGHKPTPAEIHRLLFYRIDVPMDEAQEVITSSFNPTTSSRVPPESSVATGSKQNEDDDLPLKRLKDQVISRPPSSLCEAVEFSQVTGPDHSIGCNRPFERNTIPISLLDEAFGYFKSRCERPPSNKALILLSQLAQAACAWHELDVHRRTAIQELLQAALGLDLQPREISGSEHITDGHLWVTVMPAAIRGCRNECGVGLDKAILFYAHFLHKALRHPHRYVDHKTCFPSILLVDMGSYMEFHGAMWDGDRVRAEPLTPMFDLTTHQWDEAARMAIASSLDAFMETVAHIEGHYAAIEAKAKKAIIDQVAVPDTQPRKARKFPHFTSYEDNGQTTTLTYDSRIDDAKLIFRATASPPTADNCTRELFIKFTRRYSEDAHRCPAGLDLAPTLRQCVETPGGWFAVVMDRSKYEPLFKFVFPDEEWRKVRAKARHIVEKLHDAGFVHGDVRYGNFLVDRESVASETDDVKMHLIDFDWAGRAGQVKYPWGVNTITVMRPDGVRDGELITKEHDLTMLSYLD